MDQIVSAIKNHYEFRNGAQVAEFLGISRQHLYIAIKNDRLIADRLLPVAIDNNIDLTRLLRDGIAADMKDTDYSESELTVQIYKEGETEPYTKRNIQKWIADFLYRRDVHIYENLAALIVESEEMEPKVRRDSMVFIDTSEQEPRGGIYYLEVNGFGLVRKLVKANENQKWYLLTTQEEGINKEPLTFKKDFSVIGRIQQATIRI